MNTMLSQTLSFVLNMLSTSVMARLIVPESFGLVAMVTAFTGFVLIFKDLGLTSAVVQRSVISQKQISTLFWLNLGISLAISLIIAATGPFLVSFYNEPRLFHITLALAGTVFLTGSVLQHGALMKRQMRFKRISAIHVAATATSITVGIVMALLNFDYWAVIGITAAYSVSYTAMLWLLCDWRPSFYFQFDRVKNMVRFGAGVTGFDIVNYFSRNADNMLIGRYFGSAALGLYSKSYQLLMLPITQLRDPLNTVAFPALSSLKNQYVKYREFYARYNFILAFFSMPLVMFLVVFSKEVVLLVLGAQWLEASRIFQLLAVTSLIQPVAGTKGVVMITMGQTKRYFAWGGINAVATVCAFLIGMNWGVDGMVIAYALVNYTILVPSLFFCFKGTPISVSLFFRELALPFVLSLVSGLACLAIRESFSELAPLALLIVGLLVGGACYLVPWSFTSYSRNKFKQILAIRQFMGK
ncbi:lipopolysaccharide biosynthesis protein [Parapedobacter sp. 10938]|uniref:lipopolysaccharide biosynthesis protein n=1 Tax=Parapedobacter flavus TaxID=3110225 RepID=UPI002DB70D76|nr:lipopolysaccharide biosynthesis protein [Parapedobacter sp. 10938]MEC3879894.1 lipopolysaccharide biosynthesis protein [Parapedobacter sp. 10938]